LGGMPVFMRGLLWGGFAARRSNHILNTEELGGEDSVTEVCDAIVASASVVGEAGFFDELVADHAVDGAIEGAGAQLDGSSCGFSGFFHDGVAVFFSAGQGEEDREDGGGKGYEVFCCGSASIAHAIGSIYL